MAKQEETDSYAVRPLWSGVITFGLVTLPVSLFPANRGKPWSLKMVSRKGVPLSRVYFCAAEDKPLARDEIVRGYEIDKGEFLVVEDDELRALAPEKSEEIDLREFVSLEQVDPVYFARGYFLVPDRGANKAYRLLARAMEEEERAGIATFVMRDREYLVAIVAEARILRAETLRFYEEVRAPDDVGLPSGKTGDEETVEAMCRTMGKLTRKKLAPRDLTDAYADRLQKLIAKKEREGKDVVKAPVKRRSKGEKGEKSNVIDLMEVLKARLQGETESRENPNETGPGGKSGADGGPRRSKKRASLEKLSKSELYKRAKNRGIRGRSDMTKRELIDALS